MAFPVVMYGCESWTVKKAKCWRIDAFELWYWRRLLRVPWTARRSNQSILKEISPEYSVEGLMLKLENPILWPPDAKNWLIGKHTDAGKDWRWEEKGRTQWTCWIGSGSWWWTGKPGMLQSMEVTKSRTRLNNWTELKPHQKYEIYLNINGSGNYSVYQANAPILIGSICH